MIRASQISPRFSSASSTQSSRRQLARSQWANRLKQWGILLLQKLTAPADVKIQKINRNGSTYWSVYDPTSGQSAYLSSEQEVRIWLEQRYNG